MHMTAIAYTYFSLGGVYNFNGQGDEGDPCGVCLRGRIETRGGEHEMGQRLLLWAYVIMVC